MTIPLFPALPGQTFAIKTPVSATNIASDDSGREARTPIYGGLYEFELAFDGLAADGVSYPGLSAQSLQAILGLYLQCQGGFGTFLYADPNDNAVMNQAIATGDGATTLYTLGRSMGAGFDTDFYVTSLAGVTVNGTDAGGFTLVPPNLLSFSTAPASGAAIAASFSYAFVCRFVDDAADFENFMQNLWSTQSLKFRSVRQ
ncbi:MAG TPA: DUF2460 domain-containing protein [Methylocystis sp.]|nr:DUF2460 domain-containing protein [Methylocystis sp.]